MENDADKAFNLDELERLSEGDEKFVTEMIGIFINTTQSGLDEIEQSLKKEDFKVVSAYAHKIATPCLHMGALNLHAVLKKIEQTADQTAHRAHLEKLVSEARILTDKLILDLKKLLPDNQ